MPRPGEITHGHDPRVRRKSPHDKASLLGVLVAIFLAADLAAVPAWQQSDHRDLTRTGRPDAPATPIPVAPQRDSRVAVPH